MHICYIYIHIFIASVRRLWARRPLRRPPFRFGASNIHMYIYIYIYMYTILENTALLYSIFVDGDFQGLPFLRHKEGTGSVRFGSGNNVFWFDAVRPALFERVVARSGSVRFGSFPRPVPAGSRIKRFGSVRPLRFGFLFLPEKQINTLLKADHPLGWSLAHPRGILTDSWTSCVLFRLHGQPIRVAWK